MAHLNQILYCESVKTKYPQFFKKIKVLDIGSLDINGSNRYLFEDCDYLGIDVGEGRNVDLVCVGHEFEGPDNYFDTIISTEVFEHDMHYEKTITNVMRMLKPGGLFVFTCASTGRAEHGTRRSDSSWAAPLLMEKEDDWADYYKNLILEDIEKIEGFKSTFSDGTFGYNGESCDLYFTGIKNGRDYLKYNI
jgi:SAM-dependent methyltransferase